MALVNENFLQLTENYLFADIAKKVNAYKVLHPRQKVISLGIGDVTQPLCPSVIKAMHKAVDEMANADTFKGYGPEHGYAFLREAILKHDFHPRGIRFDPSEIFINDGAKSDLGNIGDILRWDNLVAVTDPVYPVYVDSNAMAGRAGINRDGQWSDITYLPTTAENDFCPELPDHGVDVIYLCYPNNPTGTVLTKAQLEKWVKYALKQEAIILYDAAYEAYIQEPDIPHSIYEIRGARKCAIEFHSYSKTAGFTGVRCGYTVVPKELIATSMRGQSVALNVANRPSSMAPATSHNGLPKPSTHRKDKARFAPPLLTIWRMPKSCAKRYRRLVSRSMAESMLPTFGYELHIMPIRGHSLRNCFMPPALCVRQVKVSVLRAKNMFASQPSATVKTVWKR